MLPARPVDVAKMNSLWWYHKIDFGDGVVTPGLDLDAVWQHISRFLDGIDFKDKTVLDIGCWDGKWTFEAERRGARLVVATDDASQRGGGEESFMFAHATLGSKAVYYPHVGVYDIDELAEKPFDIVLFMGVLYHLHYPFYALAKIRQVLKPGGIVVVETACCNDDRKSYLWLQLELEHTIYPDPTTWCAPSTLALRGMLERSYFVVGQSAGLFAQPTQSIFLRLFNRLVRGFRPNVGRMIMEGRAVVRPDAKYLYADSLLSQFDTRFRE